MLSRTCASFASRSLTPGGQPCAQPYANRGSTSRAAMPAKHAPSPSCLARGCVLHFRCLQTSASAAIPASHADAPCVTLCARGSAAGFGSPPVKAEPPPAMRIFHPSRRAVSWSIFMCHAKNGQRRRLLDSARRNRKSPWYIFIDHNQA